MNKNKISKFLCLLLRHDPEKAHLDMDEHGWVSVEQLILGVNSIGEFTITKKLLEEIVDEDEKGRYRFNDRHDKIKCCQGHSIPWVTPELEYVKPPTFLYHGTNTDALKGIMKSGSINKMKRHAVQCKPIYQKLGNLRSVGKIRLLLC